jgi:hypothetical protein
MMTENNEYIPSKLQVIDMDLFSKQKQKIDIKPFTKNNVFYYILNYDKTLTCFDNKIAGLYRSVIFAYPEKVLLSYCPAKSFLLNTFIEKYPKINEDIYINEFVDGVMVNLFYDYRIEKWEIATKTKIGGNYKKFSNSKMNKSTFKKMFMDVFSNNEETTEINDIPLIKLLSKYYSYSFILRHPDMWRSSPFLYPEIYVVAVYRIYNHMTEYVPPFEYENWDIFKNINSVIQFPNRKRNIKTYDELFDTCNGIYDLSKKQSFFKGFMITNTITGERTKIITDSYIERNKRTIIEPNLQYQFFCLNRIFHLSKKTTNEKKINNLNWIKNCPIFKKQFFKINELMEEFIKKTHEAYLSLYVLKDKLEISPKYYTHIYKIHHGIYLPSLKNKSEKIKITRQVIQNYFYNMEPRELLFLYNL